MFRPSCRKDGHIGRSDLALQPCSSSLQQKASLLRPIAPPPSPATQNLQPSSPSAPPECSILPKDALAVPSNPSSLQPPVSVLFPSPSDHIIGYGRYRKWKCAPNDAIIAHIDAQLAGISDLLASCNMLDVKIPGHNDITFGDYLRVKSEREIEQARVALKPSEEISPNGTIIHRGFPAAEHIIMRAAAHNSLGPLLADQLVGHTKKYGYCSEDHRPCFNPMARPDKGTGQAWEKIGFTKHPLPTQNTVVPRKWNELEKLKPKWGPAVAKREALERDRQEQRAAAYIRVNSSNVAGCFRLEKGEASTECRVNIGGKRILGGRLEVCKFSELECNGDNDDDDNEDRTRAKRDIENAIESDSESDGDSDGLSDDEEDFQTPITVIHRARNSSINTTSGRTALSTRRPKPPFSNTNINIDMSRIGLMLAIRSDRNIDCVDSNLAI